jgi:hypothetical protein
VLITPESHRQALLPHIPAEYRAPLGLPAAMPPAAADQTSASKG